jgi:hypothetical protein
MVRAIRFPGQRRLLGIGVDEEGAVAVRGKTRGQVDCRGAFTCPSLLIADRNDHCLLQSRKKERLISIK